jgi:flagellar biogenesis protein FliO
MHSTAVRGRILASALLALAPCLPAGAEPVKAAPGVVQAAPPPSAREAKPESPASDAAPVTAAKLFSDETRRTIDLDAATSGAAARPAAEWGAILPFMGWTALILALLGAGAFVARRVIPAARRRLGGDAVRLLVRRTLTPQHSVLLVEVGPRLLLLGATKTGLTALTEFRDPEEIARVRARCPGEVGEVSATAFEDSLKTSLREYETAPAAAAPAAAPAADEIGDSSRLRDAMNEIEAIKKMMSAWK